MLLLRQLLDRNYEGKLFRLKPLRHTTAEKSFMQISFFTLIF